MTATTGRDENKTTTGSDELRELLGAAYNEKSLSSLYELLGDFKGTSERLVKVTADYCALAQIEGPYAEQKSRLVRACAGSVADVLDDERWSMLSARVINHIEPQRRALHDVCQSLSMHNGDLGERIDELTPALQAFRSECNDFVRLIAAGLASLRRRRKAHHSEADLRADEKREPDDDNKSCDDDTFVSVNEDTGIVTIDNQPFSLVGTAPIRARVGRFIQELIEADGEYISRPENLKTREIEKQPDAIRDLIEAQPGAGSRIPREKLRRRS